MAEDSSTKPESGGSFGCACGKIRIDVSQPKSSTFVTPTAGLCQCHDCFSFADGVAKFRKVKLPESPEKADALADDNASDMRQIYKSDAIQMTGEEYLRGIKLRPDSPCIRYYSACCGTPIMVDYTIMPFLLVYQHTISQREATESEASLQKISPTVVLNHKAVPPGSAPTPEGIPVKDGVTVGFIAHALARAIAGFVTFKKTSAIAPQMEKVPVSIGVGSIGKQAEEKEDS